MKLFLACGPIFEPLIGMICSTIACIGLLIFLGLRFFKGEKYRDFKNSGSMDKTFSIILFIAVGSVVGIFLWWILMFVFTGITFLFTGNF